MAGVLERIAPFSWRLVIPWPQSTSKLDVFELTPGRSTSQTGMSEARVARRPGGGPRDPGRVRAGRARRSAIPKCWRCSATDFTRPKMRALCKVLAYVDDEAEERGEPELAVLVVRQSDGLPGQGWWVGGAKKHGYTGPVGRAEGGEADPQAPAAGVRVLGGTRGLAFAKRAGDGRGAHLHRQRRRRRHPARPLVQAAHAGRQLQPRLALGADGAAAARRQAGGARATGSRPGRRSAFRRPKPRRPRPARPQPQARSADARTKSSSSATWSSTRTRTPSCSTSRRGWRRRAGPRPTQHLDRLLDGLADEAGTAEARPSARQGHVGRAAGGADGARGRAFRQGLLRAHGAQGLLGAGRRRARRRRRA